MKEPLPGTKPRYCHKCGARTLVADDAEPFFSTSTGEPLYRIVDERCPNHGQLYVGHKGWAMLVEDYNKRPWWSR